jgi:hypothetical protein
MSSKPTVKVSGFAPNQSDAVDDRNEGDLKGGPPWQLSQSHGMFKTLRQIKTTQRWRDLSKLADVVGDQGPTRRAWAQDILLKKCATASQRTQ